MKWFAAAVRVEQFDDGDRLRFRITSERRLAALLLPMLTGIALLLYAWQKGPDWLLLLAAVALIGFPVWRWFQVRVTELRVTEQELVAEGDLGRENGILWLQWAEVSGLQHARGDHEQPDGLYALKGIWDRVCLVPNLNEAQVTAIVHTIYSHFPYIAMAEVTEPPSLP